MGQLPLIRVVHQTLQQTAPQPFYVLARGTWRFLRPWISSRVLADHFPGIPGRVHHEDHMLDTRSSNSITKYRRVGMEAYGLIEDALRQNGRDWTSLRTMLDYGCGHGRVLRWVAVKQPAVQLVAADVNEQAVRFCASEFGATPHLVKRDVAQLSFPTSFDVIWAGSVFTHLSADHGRALLAALIAALAPGGLMLFTTHGELIPERVPEYGRVVAGRTSEIESTLASDGISFLPGDAISGPVTFHARAAVRAHIAAIEHCELVLSNPRGWDDHQDVWVVRRTQP
jgi:SAM-dependent methyltransferase